MIEAKLPYNIEAEAAFLGALLSDVGRSIADGLAAPLTPEHFYEPLHGRIFDRAMTAFNKGEIANPVTLKPFFDNDEAMKAVGGPGYMAKLTGSGAGIIGAHDLVRQIYDLALLREIVSVSRSLIETAMDTSESIDPRSLIDDAEQRLGSITGADLDDKQAYSAAECVDEVMAEWDRPVTGVRCGCIPELDDAIGKIKPTEFILGAGRPGSGKTALAISYGNGVARKALDATDPDGGGVLFFSHEMSALQVGGRLITDTAAYTNPLLYQRVESGELDDDERKRVRAIREYLRKVPFEIVPIDTLTVVEMRRRVRRWKRIFEKRGFPLRLVIVDYLQLMTGSKKSRDENRQAEISEISRGLKQIAMSEKVGVFELSQLRRAG
jgi:replicative DNA helicase